MATVPDPTPPPPVLQAAGKISGAKQNGRQDAVVCNHDSCPQNGTVERTGEGGCESNCAEALSHHKNDSGSYDTPPTLPSSSTGVTILISNGTNELESRRGSAQPTALGSARTMSSASVSSERSQLSAHPSSSSSSLSCDLSHASSFNSKELLEQLVSAASLDSMDGNEVVQQLLEHIVTLKLQLEELKLENQKLKQVRSTMDDELHTLTENLFEEAYKMVDTAKEEKGLAVKRLADAAGKIDAMETEMSALKNLLHAPPTTLNEHKTSSPHSKHRKPNVKKAIRKLSRKIKSPGKSTTGGGATAVTAGGASIQCLEHKSDQVKGASLKQGQMDPNEFTVFSEWLNDLTHEGHPYLLKVLEEDIKPCLNFRNKQLSVQLVDAVRSNGLLMESLSPCTAEEERVCVLSACEQICCTHRMQLPPSQEWHFISQHCRDRIAAVCDFYMYVSHIQKGILKQDASQLYWQVNRLRAQMNLARLTLQLPD